MRNKIDLSGQVFGRLLVVEEAEKRKSNMRRWKCECVCGNQLVVFGSNLKRGFTTSCGCLRRETTKRNNTTHGLVKHPLYQVWNSMKTRCYNKKNKRYSCYGGRGIKVCDRWLESFENFYSDMLEGYEKGLQLDRIDNDGDYEPNNCRWVTAQQNTMNTGSRKNTSSKFKGVYWNKASSKWHARIMKDGEYSHLGYFEDEVEAAKAYNSAAKELFKDYANLNKIDDTE